MFVSARFRTYSHATEDEDRVKQALRLLTGASDKEIKVTINRGYHGNEIRVLETRFRKGPKLTNFLERLVENGIYERLEDELETRLDDECVLYLRFDKQEAYQGRWVLHQGEDTIQVKAKVQSFPAKPKKAVEEVRKQMEKISKRLARSSK